MATRALRIGARLVPLALLAAACSSGSNESASDFPSDNVEIIVPFSAGGPTDTVTRMIAEPMAAEFGTQVVVRNVEGAGGTVGAGEAAQADADGHTVLMHHIGMATAPALYKDLDYSPQEDFQPVGLVTEVPMTIIARKDFEPENLEELVAYVKSNKDEVTYAHAGIGSASQLCGTLLQQAIGVEVQEVAYKGTAPAIADLLGGHVDFLCDQTTNTTSHITSDAVKAYAVTTPERVKTLPDLQTTAEAGLPEVEISVWHGLYVPADTPDDVVATLTAALQSALADQKVIDQMAELGTAPVSASDATPEAHSKLLAEQTDLWAELLKDVEPQ